MRYRKLDIDTAEDIMDWCENNGKDHEVWDPEKSLLGCETDVELGLPQEVWKQLGY